MLKSYEATYQKGRLRWINKTPDIKDGTTVTVIVNTQPDSEPCKEEIRKALDEVENARAIFLTGGTGLTKRDITWQVVETYCDEPLPAFEVLFTQPSYMQVGSAAVLSRATAGIKRNRGQLIAALPGSSKACALAMDDILIPELAHIAGHLHK